MVCHLIGSHRSNFSIDNLPVAATMRLKEFDMSDPIVTKFKAAFDRIRANGSLVQPSTTVFGADIWEYQGFRAYLTDGGYGFAINGPIYPPSKELSFRAYNNFGSGSEQIIFMVGTAEDLDNIG